MKIAAAVIAVGACLAMPSPTHAAEPFDIELFQPLPSQGINHLQVGASRVLTHLTPSFGFVLHYETEPFVLRNANDDIVTRIVDKRLTSDFWAAIGLFDFLEIGVALPVVFTQSGDDLASIGRAGSVDGASLGDLRIVPKLQLFQSGGFGLGLLGVVSVPTGAPDEYSSDDHVRGQVRALIDYEHKSGFAVALDGGLDFRPRHTSLTHISDDNVTLGVAVRVPLGMSWLRLLATAHALVPLVSGRDANDLTIDATDGPGTALEGDLALEARFGDFVASVGAGHGFTEGVGSPELRVFGLFGYTPEDGDRDKDGIKDSRDDCPDVAEDKDGFQDEDGCPDLDNDQDGILDLSDGAVDASGFGACRNQPEDKDGFQDDDGCPDPDNDQDGILDSADKCPNVAEDKDGLGDEDGCPEDDFDGDGIPDTKDKCPRDPETMNGFEDEDGCPDTGPDITLTDIVYFDTNASTIKPASFRLLDQVVVVLKAHPEITEVAIDGHADERGPDDYNQALTERRAASVVAYLSNKGIDSQRLQPRGYGESRPVDPGHDESAWVKNRRVELKVLSMTLKTKVAP